MNDEIKGIALQVAALHGIRTGTKLRLVEEDVSQPHTNERLSVLQRDVICSRIVDMAELYGLQWLVRQETAEVLGVIEALPDAALYSLLKKIRVGRDCCLNGTSYDEAGLVRELSFLDEWMSSLAA